MTDTQPDAPPTEDELLTSGEDGGFDLERWKFALAAGKYDGHLIEMSAWLAQRAITDNRRRWRIRWRDDEVTEDEYTLEAAAHAETFTGLPWGAMNMSMGANVQMNAKVAQGLLYGMARDRFNMDEKAARRAVREIPAVALMDLLGYFESEPLGKDGTDQSPTS